MKKLIVNHHKAHRSRQWRTAAPVPGIPSRPGRRRYLPAGRCVRAESAGTGFPSPGESLNWSLRRYVRASSLRVWLKRQVPEADGVLVPVGRHGLTRAAVRRARRPGKSAAGTGRTARRRAAVHGDRAQRYRIDRNGQMEHFAKVAAVLQGTVRRDAAITPRECAAAADLATATLGNEACVQSNIFGFLRHKRRFALPKGCLTR